MTTLIAKNGRKYKLAALTNRIEYGEETLQEMAVRLGEEVATVVGQNVTSRERRFAGYFVGGSDAAWVFRLVQGGDHWLPKRSTRVVSHDPRSGQVLIAIPPSLAAQIEGQFTPRNLLYFTTQQVAQRLNVSVETVQKWIRDGYLGADSVSNGSAAFEYRVSEMELRRFASQYGNR